MKGMSMADVLGEDEDESAEYESDTPDEYSAHVDALASALGVDSGKAERVAEAVCALARHEMESGGGASPMHGGGKKSKPSIAVVLGGK